MNLLRTKLEMIQALAQVQGSRVRIIDRNGKALSRWFPREVLESQPIAELEQQLRWQEATRKQAQRMASRNASTLTSWKARTKSLEVSFRLRRRSRDFDPKPRARQLFECYRTSNWDAAAKRMWHQAHNRFRRHASTGWARWSCTVANNHNKKKGGRYGKTCNGHGSNDHEAR